LTFRLPSYFNGTDTGITLLKPLPASKPRLPVSAYGRFPPPLTIAFSAASRFSNVTVTGSFTSRFPFAGSVPSGLAFPSKTFTPPNPSL